MKQNQKKTRTTRPFHSKYRPTNFDTIIGQEHIISHFKNAIEKQQVSFAYLFVGKHGVGKTTLSRVIAKTLNCTGLYKNFNPCNVCSSCTGISLGQSFDVHEINASLNTGIDSIREIIERIQLSPFNSFYKVCIIDEVHMLSLSACNALLKILEEPPKNVVFILATTDIKKIPNTIVSRCHKLSFSSLSKKELAMAISNIVWLENGNITNMALSHIINCSEGSFRDAINMVNILMIQSTNINQKMVSFLFTDIPYSISKLFLRYLMLENIYSVIRLVYYLHNKQWLDNKLINQIQSTLQDEILSNSQTSIRGKYLLSLWQLLLKYDSYDFSSNSLSNFIFDLFVLFISFSSSNKLSVLNNRKTIPSFVRMNIIYIY